ncbi:MAG: hypothetical protein JHC20_00010 [Pyrobaculum sp.]|nr:hypothetical protein [Pyrobaculum sp.]
MYGAHMATVIQVLGPHSHYLRRYGVDPLDDVATAVKKLAAAAPHLANFLKEASIAAELQ